jgi:Cu-Zn family superoxide dismutase
MPNVKADEQGRVDVQLSIAGATLRDGGPNNLVGKAFVVHAKADDYKTQPSGDAGDRIACGVVR